MHVLIWLQLWMHGSKMESLHKHLDPDYLPADYGGRRPKIDYSSANWYPTLSTIDHHLNGKLYILIVLHEVSTGFLKTVVKSLDTIHISNNLLITNNVANVLKLLY